MHRHNYIGVILLVLVMIGAGWFCRDLWKSPEALYASAQGASPERAATLYGRLAEKLPQIEAYARLWGAEVTMPELEALRTLEAVAAYRPQSPAAYEAWLALARHYAVMEAPQAEDAYRAALALQDDVPLRLELAAFLEAQGDGEGAYAEYRHILGACPDAFAGMRRTGSDPLEVAADLNAAFYYSDAVETLRDVDLPEARPLRAKALSGLGRYEEALPQYRSWLEDHPDDTDAQLGLAQALVRLGRAAEAGEIYERLDTPDGKLARAELLEAKSPDEALALYEASPYPVAWWNATALLESQDRLTETLPLYERLAESGTYFADDAAYRLYVLGKRLGDDGAQAWAETLLAASWPNWLALRVSRAEPALAIALPFAPAGEEILEKVAALEQIDREDLARMELSFAMRFRRAPEVRLAMAEALVTRGEILEVQPVAEAYLADHHRAPLSVWRLSYPRPYSDTVASAAATYDLDPLLIWSVMRQESRFDPQAVSYAGARGLMQVMPATQSWIAEQWGETIAPGEAFTPEVNIRMGAWFLRFLMDYFEGDLDLVIAAYNGGAASVDQWLADPLVSDRDDFLRWIGFGQSREYLEEVSLNYRIYQQLYPDD